MPNYLGTRRVLRSVPLVWPTGTGGALVLTNGQTLFITPGTVYNYASVQVDAGANIYGVTGSSPIVIGCRGNFTFNGDMFLITNPSNGTFSTTAPDGTSFSYTVARFQGGAGGFSGYGINGGNPSSGNGGGGGGYVTGFDAASSFGGTGGDGFVDGGGGGSAGGQGGFEIDAPDGFGGEDGTSGSGDGVGAGGGGGFHGYNGQGIYIKVGGNCAGTGTIWVGSLGLDGGFGGGGGNGYSPDAGGYGGAGGGGGAGGQGGKIKIRYHGTAPSWTLLRAGGNGGTGGGGGAGTGSSDSVDGAPGNDGAAGASGSIDVAAY